MKSLHNTNVVRPDVNLKEVRDYSLFEIFGQYREYLKDKYIRDDGSIISKGIFEVSVYKNCEGFEEKLEKYFGKEYFREVVYCILRDIEYIPRCQICGNLNYLRDWIKGFQKFCSSNCACRSQKTEEWAEKIKASLPKHKYVNERLEKLGIHNYVKDPYDSNYILIYGYCKHHTDEPLRLYFNTLNKLIENGRGTLCIECNQEIYDSYVPTEEETQRFRDEAHLFFREYGAVINNPELSMKFFPKERKILDLYFENNVFGENKDQIISLNERNYYFEFEKTTIPVCRYDGCHNKPKYHRLKAYNLYCDDHLHAFRGQSEFEREVCSYISNNMSKEEVYECLLDNYIISDDMNVGVDYKTDFHIIASGFDIYIDYKCDDKFGRAFVNLPSDRDLIYASKKINSKYSKNEIEVWSEYEPRKRKYALDNSIIYLELYSCINCEHLYNQIDYILCSLVGENNSILLSDLKDEFEYYSKLCCKKEISEYKVNSKNNIVRYFQWREFYKSELNIYAYNPELRRKLIQNRCQYLDKKESELSFMSLIGGFKKSGIFYGYSHFNPAWSNWFINRYNIKTVYDPFGGWGHHMLGMLSCDRVIYNDIDENVCYNIEKIKKFFNLDFLKVHNSDAAVFYPDDVDAFFMCPPYLNVERYSSRFDTLDDFKNTLNQVFKIWEQNKAYILGIMIREDFISLIDSRYVPLEEYLIDVSDSHFTKEHKKRFKEKLYIFAKSNINM